MKNYIFGLSTTVFILVLSACKAENKSEKDEDPLAVESLYLGQKPPGLIPEVFAPETISNASDVSFSPDLDEVYFSVGINDEKNRYLLFKTPK